MRSRGFRTTRKGGLSEGTARTAGYSAVLVAVIILASMTSFRSAANWGWYNYNMALDNASWESAKITISNTLTASNSYTGPALTCSYHAQWSDQWNILDAGELNNAWIQVAVTVNPSGDSCFAVQYWPSYWGSTSDFYDFNIGYSSDFINSGNDITFALDASNYVINEFTVQVTHDSWTIYANELYPSNPTEQYDGSTISQVNIVGCCATANAWFTGGSGYIYYYSAENFYGSSQQITGEGSNMGYNSLQEVNPQNWYQTYVHCGTCINGGGPG